MGNSSTPENHADLPHRRNSLSEPAAMEKDAPDCAECPWPHSIFINSRSRSHSFSLDREPKLRNWGSDCLIPKSFPLHCFFFLNHRHICELQIWNNVYGPKLCFYPASLFLLANINISCSWKCFCSPSKGVCFSHEWAFLGLRSRSCASALFTRQSFVRVHF